MATRDFLNPGIDLTVLPAAATNAQITQSIRESTPATDIGYLIKQEGTPDVSTHTEYTTFFWLKPSTSEVKFWNGSSWQLIRGLTVLNDGSILISKLGVGDGDPGDLIRINSAGTAFEYVSLTDILPNDTIVPAKLQTADDAGYVMLSGAGGSWAYVLAVELIKSGFSVLATAASGVQNYENDFVIMLGTDGYPYQIHTKVLGDSMGTNAPIIANNNTSYFFAFDGARAAGNRLVRISSGEVLPTIGNAASYNNPTSISIDNKGRVTAVGTTGRGTRTSAAIETNEYNLPANNASVSIAHGLGAAPSRVYVRLKCVDVAGDKGYVQNTIISLTSITTDASGDENLPLVVEMNATHIIIQRPNGDLRALDRTGDGNPTDLTASKWRLLISAEV